MNVRKKDRQAKSEGMKKLVADEILSGIRYREICSKYKISLGFVSKVKKKFGITRRRGIKIKCEETNMNETAPEAHKILHMKEESFDSATNLNEELSTDTLTESDDDNEIRFSTIFPEIKMCSESFGTSSQTNQQQNFENSLAHESIKVCCEQQLRFQKKQHADRMILWQKEICLKEKQLALNEKQLEFRKLVQLRRLEIKEKVLLKELELKERLGIREFELKHRIKN